MRKLLFILIALIVFNGCSGVNNIIEKDKNTGFAMADARTSISAVEGSADKQKFSYEFIISNDRSSVIEEESIQVLLNDWISKRLIEHSITQIKLYKDDFVVKGNAIFDTRGLTKEDVLANAPFVEAIKFSSNGEEYNIQPFK